MTAIGVPAGSGLTPAARILGNETGKGLQLLWHRRGLMITGIVAAAVTYVLIRFLISGGHITRPMVAVTLPALVLGWVFAAGGALQGSGGIAEEVNGGTLEQAHLSPARPALLMAGRLAALAAEALIVAFVLGLGFGLGYDVHYSVRPDVLVPLLLTIGDALGYALVMTALTLRVASIGAIVHVFGMVIMVFGGMAGAARAFPLTAGIASLYGALLGHRSVTAPWGTGGLVWLLVTAAAYLAAGILAFRLGEQIAKTRGSLARY